jgi:hypothetical protein
MRPFSSTLKETVRDLVYLDKNRNYSRVHNPPERNAGIQFHWLGKWYAAIGFPVL